MPDKGHVGRRYEAAGQVVDGSFDNRRALARDVAQFAAQTRSDEPDQASDDGRDDEENT